MRRQIHSLLLSTLAAAAACSDSTKISSGLDAGGALTAPFSCVNGVNYAQPAMDALRTALGVDYLEIRAISPAQNVDADGGSWQIQVTGTSGTKCGTATDGIACSAALEALPITDYFPSNCGNCIQRGTIFVYTRGNVVKEVSNHAELMALIDTVDAPAEAWILAILAGYQVSCATDPWIREASDGYVLLASHMISDCPIRIEDVVLHVSRSGQLAVLEGKPQPESSACMGRRPSGLLDTNRNNARDQEIRAHFVEIARLEAASVDAFEILARELAEHGAPDPLLRAASRAARDEKRHARAMAEIARRYGAEEVHPPQIVHGPVRSLFEIAIENAVEGCVRETYGALEGLWQAQAASDPMIRKVMSSIALDEVRHSELAWQVADWIEAQLSPQERTAVDTARRQEAARFCDRAGYSPNPELVDVAGVPNQRQASFFAAQLLDNLWLNAA